MLSISSLSVCFVRLTRLLNTQRAFPLLQSFAIEILFSLLRPQVVWPHSGVYMGVTRMLNTCPPEGTDLDQQRTGNGDLETFGLIIGHHDRRARSEMQRSLGKVKSQY